MKTEFQDVSETQKKITIEIPSDVVDAEIDRVAKGYSKQARLPGFRPGKVPSNIIKQRFRDEIHHEGMHGLIPRAVEEARQESGIEPVSTPDIKDVSLREGEPLKFTADIETVPPFDPGDLSTITLRQHRSEEHTSELQSPHVISYAVFCLNKTRIFELLDDLVERQRGVVGGFWFHQR